MQRACFTFELAEGLEDEYDRRHREGWPELAAELRAAGVSNYTFFQRNRFSGVIVILPGDDGGLSTVPRCGT